MQFEFFFKRYRHLFNGCKIITRPPGLGLGVHVVDQINHSVAVAELVVVPGDELHEGPGQLDSSLGIKDG